MPVFQAILRAVGQAYEGATIGVSGGEVATCQPRRVIFFRIRDYGTALSLEMLPCALLVR